MDDKLLERIVKLLKKPGLWMVNFPSREMPTLVLLGNPDLMITHDDHDYIITYCNDTLDTLSSDIESLIEDVASYHRDIYIQNLLNGTEGLGENNE